MVPAGRGGDAATGERYDGYLQLENGVGMMRLLENEFQEAFDGLPGDDLSRGGVCGHRETGLSAYMQYGGEDTEPVSRATVIHTYQIENRYFGERITVAGLITGQDLKEQLAGKDLGRRFFSPVICFAARRRFSWTM